MGDSDDDVHLGTRSMYCACFYTQVLLLRSLQTVVAVRFFGRAGKKALTSVGAGLIDEEKFQLVTC